MQHNSFGWLSYNDVTYVFVCINSTLSWCVQIRPNAVALVDAFDHTDDYLGSALGRYDGDVYTHLYKGAFKESLNDTVVVDGYQEYLKPLLTQNMWGPQSKL